MRGSDIASCAMRDPFIPMDPSIPGKAGVNSLIQQITQIRGRSIPFFRPKSALLTTEAGLVKDVLYILQGFASTYFPWNETTQQFSVESGLHVSHLSMSSLYNLLVPFVAAATNLQKVEIFVKKVAAETTGSWLKCRPQGLPTLEAFANAVAMRLQCLRKPALEKELEAVAGGAGTSVTLLSLMACMSWVFAGSEFLKNVVENAVPDPDLLFEKSSSAAESASHILTSLYEQLDDICLLEDGEEEAYRTILLLFVGTLRPLTKSLDAWLQEGTLSDPSGELFIYGDSSIPIEDAAFWQRGFQLRRQSTHDVQKVNSDHILSKGQSVGPSIDVSGSQNSSPRSLIENVSPRQTAASPGGTELDVAAQRAALSTWGGSTGESEDLICPVFLQCLAKSVVSAGKSLQLLQHIWRGKGGGGGVHSSYSYMPSPALPHTPFSPSNYGGEKKFPAEATLGSFSTPHAQQRTLFTHTSENCYKDEKEVADQHPQMSLFEELSVSLRKLLVHDNNIPIITSPEPYEDTTEATISNLSVKSNNFMETFYQIQAEKQRHKEEGYVCRREQVTEVVQKGCEYSLHEVKSIHQPDGQYIRVQQSLHVKLSTPGSEEAEFSSVEPTEGINITELTSPEGNVGPNELSGFYDNLKQETATEDESSVEELRAAYIRKCTLQEPQEDPWRMKLSLSAYSHLPPLNDSQLRESIFGGDGPVDSHVDVDGDGSSPHSVLDDQNRRFGSDRHTEFYENLRSSRSIENGTAYTDGEGCGNLLATHMRVDLKALERLMPYPTQLPSFQEKVAISEVVAPHHQNQVAAQTLDWLQRVNFKATPSPAVLVQECLISSIERRVHSVSHQLLERLMGEWRLMEELVLLRAIYLIGSGDLLQQFASVLFNKLDRGESWDDYYELNTMLQESVRSSAHGMTSPALESLVVKVEAGQAVPGPAGSSPARSYNTLPLQIMGRSPTAGIDTLDSLRFHYKVAWPLELIIDSNAIKKYNQVMAFLMKVKRAKHALDKACRWTWKNGGGDAAHHKQRLLLQQKLMHFVNTLHQYVMDRVLYSSWIELSEGMAAAGSLDEVIACHDAYLVSIQRQCLVAPDKLWTLIAGRVKTILGLALDYYSIQRTLCDGIAAPNITARCQLEIERVERQFDECMVFLLRVLSFRLNVGHFPHLSDLVTRINYNYYYMTEDGQILTPIPDTQGHMSRRPARRV